MSKIYSPFEDSGFFGLNNIVGRENLLSYFNSQLIEKNYSKPSYFLITGNDRMGKSSFLKYFDKFTNDLDYLSAFVYVDENEINDIDFIIQKIISNIIFNLKNRYLKYSFKELKENREIVEQDKYCYEEIISELEESIVNIGYSEINFKKSFISYVKNNFVEFMMYLMSKINHKGIHIQLDTHESFKNVKSLSIFLKWFGNIVNDLNNLKKEIPIIFTFVFPKNVFNEFQLNVLFKEYFLIGEVKRLADEDVKNYFDICFSAIDWKIDSKIINFLVDLSSGHPCMMNWCGSMLYWGDISYNELPEDYEGVHGWISNHEINSITHVKNILSVNVCDFYYQSFADLVYSCRCSSDDFKNSVYYSILKKFSDDCNIKFNGEYCFKKSEFFNYLNDVETEFFDEYIEILLNLGLIKMHKDYYSFIDPFDLILFRVVNKCSNINEFRDNLEKKIRENKKFIEDMEKSIDEKAFNYKAKQFANKIFQYLSKK